MSEADDDMDDPCCEECWAWRTGEELDEKHCETIAKRLSQDVLELEWTA